MLCRYTTVLVPVTSSLADILGKVLAMAQFAADG